MTALFHVDRPISTHAPRAGSDRSWDQPPRRGSSISTHAPRAGSDLSSFSTISFYHDFNPRSPCGERLFVWFFGAFSFAYFNPRSPCGERPNMQEAARRGVDISTHAPRAGSDYRYRLESDADSPISTHAPRAGSDLPFLLNLQKHKYFNPRSPCGERRSSSYPDVIVNCISTHAPRAGSDGDIRSPTLTGRIFQPTLPVRGATRKNPIPRPRLLISTHAPRAGSDRVLADTYHDTLLFQPTLPVRGATIMPVCMCIPSAFQPTLPVRGATNGAVLFITVIINFNPRSPCGERR